jgi:hypothetical protein
LYTFLPFPMRATCPAHLIFLDFIYLPNDILGWVQIMKFLIVQLPPLYCYFIPLRCKVLFLALKYTIFVLGNRLQNIKINVRLL